MQIRMMHKTRLGMAALVLALGVSGCGRGDAPESQDAMNDSLEMPLNNGMGPAETGPAMPMPENVADNVAAADDDLDAAARAEAQMREDADAAGMTSRSDRTSEAGSAGENQSTVQQ